MTSRENFRLTVFFAWGLVNTSRANNDGLPKIVPSKGGSQLRMKVPLTAEDILSIQEVPAALRGLQIGPRQRRGSFPIVPHNADTAFIVSGGGIFFVSRKPEELLEEIKSVNAKLFAVAQEKFNPEPLAFEQFSYRPQGAAVAFNR